MVLPALISLSSFLPMAFSHSHDNGMDMDMDMGMNLASGHMMMYFHFLPGDILWFEGWVPESKGAMVGTCIRLFLLALVDRWLAACRSMMEAYWRKRALVEHAKKRNQKPTAEETKPKISPMKAVFLARSATSFIPAHDITRGVMQVVQAALGFALMLAVMTFQVAFLLSVVIGLGVGEMFFGRYSASTALH